MRRIEEKKKGYDNNIEKNKLTKREREGEDEEM